MSKKKPTLKKKPDPKLKIGDNDLGVAPKKPASKPKGSAGPSKAKKAATNLKKKKKPKQGGSAGIGDNDLG